MLPTIKLNSDNTKVVQIAQCLTKYDPADGVYDISFKEYIEAWQDLNEHLAVDGVIGPATWKAIVQTLPTVSAKQCQYGNFAMAIQLILGCDADGIFGKKTKAAVVNYQASSGLKADGIVGPKTWSMMIVGEAKDTVPDSLDGVEFVKPKDFKQYDSKWANKMYSNHGDKNQTMRSSACGPTSGADIVWQWWDRETDPYKIAMMALEWGCRTKDSGTLGSLFKKLSTKYSESKKYGTTKSTETAIKCLQTGGYVVVCFGPGTKGKPGYQKWTKGGHYCVLWKYENGKFYINDPASSKEARAVGTYEEVNTCRKGYYCIWR